MAQRTTLGVGPALRKVREGRGLSLEEAARDTRVRREFLEGLESEEFDRLLGDVHVRGCLRTYATYLGLSPDKVIAAYEVQVPPEPALDTVTPPPGRVEPVLGGRRRRDDHRLLILVAATVLVLAAAFGVLSARRPAPEPADLPAKATAASSATVLDGTVTVGVLARRPVMITVAIDGAEPQTFSLRSDESRSFEGRTIVLSLSEGDSARVTFNGADLGFPGRRGEPWKETFGEDDPSTSE